MSGNNRNQNHTSRRKKLLFVGEGVTMAHVLRPLALARAMDRSAFEPVFACDMRYRSLAVGEGLPCEPLPCLPSETFLKRLDRGAPLYTARELRARVRDDVRLIARTKPDAIIGDFRISMGISAELCNVPYLALSNLHWSPNVRLPVPVPEHPLVRRLGVKWGGRIITGMMPFFFRLQALGFNRVRREYGLAPVGGRGAPEVYTRGTRTLYADIPDLYGSLPLSGRERCIGPVLWVPPMDLPVWWNDLPTTRPTVWIANGSSGNAMAMSEAAGALAKAGWTVMVSTAGRMPKPEGTYAARFIPGRAASERADLIVCNGGSAQAYQALACGKPILGLPCNMDQYFTMGGIERQGAGRLLRSGCATANTIRDLAQAILKDESMRRAAERMARSIRACDPAIRLATVLDELFAAGSLAFDRTPITERSATANAWLASQPTCPTHALPAK